MPTSSHDRRADGVTPPYFSVVLIAHQQREFVVDAVRSVQAQDDPAWELIAIDDGSTDGTIDVLHALAADDARIRVVPIEHTGLPSATRNAGLSRVSGEVVSFLDADDLYAPGRFGRVRRAFEASPDADVLFGDYRPFGLPKWDAISGGYLAHGGHAARYAQIGEARPGGEVWMRDEAIMRVLASEFFGAFTLNITVRRRLVDARALRFDESLLMAEDHDFVFRALRGSRCVYVPEILGHFRRQAQTISNRPSARGLRDAFQVRRRHAEAIDMRRLDPAVRRELRSRLAAFAFEWGYASALQGDHATARRAYLSALPYGARLRHLKGYVRAWLGAVASPRRAT
jgi:glycosyltransferase involved in cell wall biosynthesis